MLFFDGFFFHFERFINWKRSTVLYCDIFGWFITTVSFRFFYLSDNILNITKRKKCVNISQTLPVEHRDYNWEVLVYCLIKP